jgi:hypothetical protein
MSDVTLTVEQLNAAQAQLDQQKATLMVGRIDEALMELASADIDNLANTINELAANMVNGSSRQQLTNLVSMIRNMPTILKHERNVFQATLNPPALPKAGPVTGT